MACKMRTKFSILMHILTGFFPLNYSKFDNRTQSQGDVRALPCKMVNFEIIPKIQENSYFLGILRLSQ